MGELTDGDLEWLQTRHILEVARAWRDRSPERLPAALFERLNSMEARLLSSVAAGPLAPVPPDECVRALRRVRFEREQAEVQQDIDRLQTLGAEAHDQEINELWQRRKDLLHQIEALA